MAALADRLMLKLVTMWDIEAGLSVLVRVATEAVEDQEDKVDNEATILLVVSLTWSLGASSAMASWMAVGE